MPQDMSQFLQVFFEETEEHLATLELLLIGLDLDRPDSETLHGIFRAAHSIKGSSGMFGFDDITAVTHELETLLDRIRCGQMHLRPDMISSFLEARDVLQRLLDAHRSGSPDPGVPLLETVERLRGWLRVPEQEAAEEGFGLFDDAPARKPRTTMPSASSTKARALRNERPHRKRSGSSTRRPAHRPRAKHSASSMRHRVPHRRRNAPSACSTAPPAAPPRPVRPRKPSPRRPGAQSRPCVATASPARSGSAWKRSTA